MEAEMRTQFDWRGALRARVPIPPLRDHTSRAKAQLWIIPLPPFFNLEGRPLCRPQKL